MTVTWQGVEYEVPAQEPPQQRGLDLLEPNFAAALLAYSDRAQKVLNERYGMVAIDMPVFSLFRGETRRTRERQVYLYSRSRVPNSGTKVLSNTLESKHRYGLACDLYAIDNRTGELIWDSSESGWWATLYALVPPRFFGLTDIRPFELVHLEAMYADEMIAQADDFGLVRT